MTNQKESVNIRIDSDVMAAIREKADRERESIAVIIRRLLRKALEAA